MADQSPQPLPSPFYGQTRRFVFLSFQRRDAGRTFAAVLHDALRRRGISVAVSGGGGGKASNSYSAIRTARISIVVFSENYANSKRCLSELRKILKCMKQRNQLVLPIFYGVDPSDIRHQRNRIGEAMSAHEDRFGRGSDKVRRWREALSEAAGLSGWHLQPGCELEFIERVVEEAFAKLPPKCVHIGGHIVGLDPCIQQVKSLLDDVPSDDVSTLGIHGAVGIGKTTLAKALYNSILHQFEGASFIFNVGEASRQHGGLARLQQTILSEVLEERKIKVASVDEGISKIKRRLHNKRVLLVLDHVDGIEQLEALGGGRDWFGSGSKIIITTRDQSLLVAGRVEKTYQMKGLDDCDSLKLFCCYAFNANKPAAGYEDMSNRVVSYAEGIPLVLKEIGSKLINRSLQAWKCALDEYESIPKRKRIRTFKAFLK